MKVGVIGAGAWGTALAITVAHGGADVVLWSYDGDYKHFDGVDMPENIEITNDFGKTKDADTWLIVTPASFFRETLRKAKLAYNGQPIIICTKGAESTTNQFMSEILQSELPECIDFGVLSGPQFAHEVAQGIPTGSTLAGTNIALNAGTDALNKLYLDTTSDVIGTEICGVGKNAVALICGYNSIVARENERAMIFTRAWNEIVDMGMAAGAQMRTFLGLCGIGDLFLSATSPTSRNFSGGMAIARGEPPAGTVEGIFALNGLIARGDALGVDMPVLKAMKHKLKI
ncbi:MAG: NAD(P)H-dependent glycerol-3-phosphate dehydrogenase [Alphaproteobacteria bacterium]|nr:NAD(P)H-dependent glycerol-3-phosphate dehydrogenase [Alphaproteobacteria bacterium]